MYKKLSNYGTRILVQDNFSSEFFKVEAFVCGVWCAHIILILFIIYKSFITYGLPTLYFYAAGYIKVKS